ncbi:MAG: DUF5655 domain-containing protein [Anaerolineales bacterium]|jgi:hypothetical protein
MPEAGTFTLESHFENKSPLVRKIYNTLLSELRGFGKIVEEPKKTSIHLVNRTTFAGVVTQKSALILNIKSSTPIGDLRFSRTEKVSAKRYHQELKLTDPAQVDEQLVGWLKQAYDLSS